MNKKYHDKNGVLYYVSTTCSVPEKWRVVWQDSSGIYSLNPIQLSAKESEQEAQNDLDKYARTKKLKHYKTRRIYNLWKSSPRKFRAS